VRYERSGLNISLNAATPETHRLLMKNNRFNKNHREYPIHKLFEGREGTSPYCAVLCSDETEY
jgi:hypothetical protein